MIAEKKRKLTTITFKREKVQQSFVIAIVGRAITIKRKIMEMKKEILAKKEQRRLRSTT